MCDEDRFIEPGTPSVVGQSLLSHGNIPVVGFRGSACAPPGGLDFGLLGQHGIVKELLVSLVCKGILYDLVPGQP